MTQRRAWLVSDIWLDMQLILTQERRPQTLKNVLWAWFACDGFMILATFRVRSWARRYHIPFLNRFLRMFQTAMYAIEIASDAELGHGVFFMHSVGTVIGGDAKIGDRCLFLGNNTIGASGQPGCPRIGAGTVIGAGARVLGKIEVGENCILGANAVVVDDIPAGKVAVGMPARVIADNKPSQRTAET